MEDPAVNRFYWLMLAMTIIIALAFQGSRGLYETTEGRYAEVAREMVESGNYLEPSLDYQPHWTKPPLVYWAIAGGMKVFGQNEWGVRFYNAVAFILTVLLVTHIGTILWDKRTGIVAGFIYSTSISTIISMTTVNTDTVLTLWETAAVFCYLRATETTDRAKSGKWVAAMWISFGLGFLTKGPPALLPLSVIITWHLITKNRLKILTLLGTSAFLTIGFGWYVLVSFRHPGLWHYFLGQELVARVTTDTFHRNSEWYKPFTMYIPFLTLGAGPWLYYLVKTAIEKQLFSPKTIGDYLRGGGNGAFLFLWISIPLLVFFITQSRLPLYVLPLYAPVVLVIGRGIGSKNVIPLRKVAQIAFISGMVIIGVKGYAAQYSHKNNMRHLYSLSNDLVENKAQFVTYRENKLFGLQFYLDGNLTRLSNRKKMGYDNTLEAFLKDISKRNRSQPYIFISRPKYSQDLYNKLNEQGITIVESQGDYWTMYLARFSG